MLSFWNISIKTSVVEMSAFKKITAHTPCLKPEVHVTFFVGKCSDIGKMHDVSTIWGLCLGWLSVRSQNSDALHYLISKKYKDAFVKHVPSIQPIVADISCQKLYCERKQMPEWFNFGQKYLYFTNKHGKVNGCVIPW